MLPLHEDPHFTFRFADDRIIPRFHLEGVEAGRWVAVFKIDPGSDDRLGLLATASVGEGGCGWTSRSRSSSGPAKRSSPYRNRNRRKVRKTCCFSKNWEVPEAMTYFTMYSYNFCWAVRTLRVQVGEKEYQLRTPAMAAGLTDHIWTIREWATYPSVKRLRDGQCQL